MHRALILVLGLLAAPLLMVLTAAPAQACSCVARSLAEQVAAADAVLVGTVATRDDPPTGPVVDSAQQVRWGVAVDTVHRGDVDDRVTVVAEAGEASCGIGFTPGGQYLIVGTLLPDGTVATGLCTGTAPYAALPAADVAALGPGTTVSAPEPAPAVQPDGAARLPNASLLLGATAVLALAALVVAVAFRRRGRSRA